MSRHLWTVVVGLVVGIGSAGTAWGQTGGPAPSNNNRDSQKTAADLVNNGRGATAPPVTQDLVHVPSWSGKGPPPGPGAPGQQGLTVVTDPGIWDEKSWICWWETNRDAVLKRVMARRAALSPQALAAADAKPPAERAPAVAALLKATQAERPALRAAAAVSLGQMRQADALKPLVTLGQKDADPYVRGMVWLAVGLVGSPEAEKALLAVKPRDEFEQLGVIAGIGMLDRPGEPAFKVLQGFVAKPPSPEVGRAAVWALRVFHRTSEHDLLLSTAAPANGLSPLRSEALLALGAIADARDVDFLADAATDGLAATAPDQAVIPGGGGYARRNGAYQHPEQTTVPGGTAPAAGGRSTTMLRRAQQSPQAAAGRTPVARTSAALALGPVETGKSLAAGNIRIQNALIQNFAPYLDQGGPMYGGASILAFASGAATKDIMILRALVDMGTDPVFTGMVNPRSPLRGYAAIGIGLYLANGGAARIETRPIGSVQVGVDAGLPDFIDLNETLALRFTNKQELPDLRAACALALGLSGDPANVQRLLKGAQSIERRDELLLGYTVLALSMLGEKSALNAAGPLVSAGAAKLDVEAVATRGVGQIWPAPAAPRGAAAEPSPFEAPLVPQTGPGMMGILGRRAALLGMAVLNDPRSEAILTGAWARDRSTVQDVARTMQWCKAYKPAEALTQVVTRDQKGAVEAAMSLGWVFDTDRPSRLSRLVVGNNYHQPEADWTDRPGGSTWMVRNFPRVGDLYLYSSSLGGHPLAVKAPTTRRATTP